MSVFTFSVYDIIKRNAALFPDSTAIVDGERSITFQEFLIHVNSLASALDSFGVKPYQSVAILSMNRLEYLVLYGAAAAIGAILVPLNWRLSTDELAYILKDSNSKILFFDSTHKEQAYALKTSSKFNGELVGFDGDNIINIKQDGGDISSAGDIHSMDYGELIKNYYELIKKGVASPPTFPPFIPEPHDLFALIYTAAVSGKPRGAALSHSNIIASNIQTSITMSIGHKEIYLNMLPLCHITGMNLSLATMHMGGVNIMMEKFNAKEALFKIESKEVTLMASFPPILSALMDEMDRGKVIEDGKGNGSRSVPYDITSLKNTVGIDSPETILKFCEKTSSRFWILYGQCETSGFVTLSDALELPGSAGRQGCISNMAVVDENGMVLPFGQSGEIVARGPLVFQGFWRGAGCKSDNQVGQCGADSSAKGADHISSAGSYDTSTIRNGWHHTGDIGHIDSRGYLWFEGRKPEKELIKPGGENVYPAEVEAVILTHPDIEGTCVIGVPDPKFGEGVKAVCVRKTGSALSSRELIEFVGERIARYKKPGYVEFVDLLPRKVDGSVDRVKVKELYGS